MMVNKTNSAGAPPGTLVYLGDKQTNRVKISLIEYNETEFIEKEFYDISECKKEDKWVMGSSRWILLTVTLRCTPFLRILSYVCMFRKK